MEFTRRQLFLTSGAVMAGGLLDPLTASAGGLPDEDGHELWLRYRKAGPDRLAEYRRALTHVVAPREDAAVTELLQGLSAITGRTVPHHTRPRRDGAVIIGTPDTSPDVAGFVDNSLGPEGYVIRTVDNAVVIASQGRRGVLYGAFHLLRLLQTQRHVTRLDIRERPANPLRLVNHWDNLDGSVERGYAGDTIFDWDALPTTGPRDLAYARTLASVGINGTVVNNVNANPAFLSTEMLTGFVGLAAVLREWGVTLYLSANFACPMVLGGLPTADPFDAGVQQWWRDKAREIYDMIPDFGGFLVKADSEGQPGPLTYGRTHADGANLLAAAVRPYGGIVMWRAFIHDFDPVTWASKSYKTFQPLDGQFAANVVVQIKNGPIDFQVREPVHPLFGAMPRTRTMAELQITQEYTGQSTHLCYLVPQWKEVYDFDTHAAGPGTTVARIVDGAAGVMNFGSDRNWTRHPLAAANTHGYGRLVWNPALKAAELAEEWVRMTFGGDARVVSTLTGMLLGSWETYEDYTSPLGVGFMIAGDHFTPNPAGNAPWNRADREGTGFDRTVATGVGYTGHYHLPVFQRYESLADCPDVLLLFLHHVPYSHRLHSGKTVIQHIYDTHWDGRDDAHRLRELWRSLKSRVDRSRYATTLERFDQQAIQATLWRDSIVSYYFEAGRVLDSSRSWTQVRLDGDGLLLGGWPNLLELSAGNASPRQVELSAQVSGWDSAQRTVSMLSREFVPCEVPVTPPLTPQVTTIDLAAEAGGLPVLGTRMPVIVAPVGARCRLALDAGAASSPVLSGYERLSPSDQWDPARGFGWVGTAPQSRDRARLDVLRRDFVNDTVARTLRVQLPDGSNDVYFLIGDASADCWPTSVHADGKLVAKSEFLLGGQYSWVKAVLDGGRAVDLEFSSLPGQHWHLVALVIPDPSAELPAVVVTEVAAPSPMLCGRASAVTVTAANTTESAIDATARVLVPAGWTSSASTASIPAGAVAQLEVTVVPGPEPTITALDVEAGTDRTRTAQVLTAPPGDTAVVALDAGTATSPLLPGYQRLTSGTPMWVGQGPQSRDRAVLDDLRRDFVNDTAARVLRLELPDGEHDIWMLVGDATQPSDPTYVRSAGGQLAASPPLATGEFTWLRFSVAGGAELELSGDPGKHWHLNALVVRT
ncbi:glycoside hydrolase [Kribbella turkmenica]|uniref:Xylan alpha-1,2-glucuronidase n=1 Tax=Kribbella turkmenica TaxID=2530375 RepID=A0A4R4WAM8_9ACTN|nr:alpha-glucuronidase family glycosyl hydrolase [Kribbella turkmenica]TDD14147.1 glycoside hydrolase [Kribbella turkmenica]